MPFISAHSLKCYNKPSLNNYLVYAQMATENVGGIQYTVDADTAAMIKAEASIQKILNNMVKSFEKIDKTLTNTANQFQSKMGASTSAVKSTESTVSKSTKGIADDFTFTGKAVEASSFKFSQGMNKTSSSVTATQKVVKTETDKIVNEINDVGEAATKAGGVKGSGIGSLNTQVSGTAKAVRSARPNMANMSYQLQDIAVQTQMGTNAFIVMSQQIPQMLVGMGAWAAGIGAAIAVLGLLITTTMDSTTSIEKLEKAIESSKAIMTLGKDGISEYTAEMKKLSEASEDLAKIKVAIAINKNKKAIKETKKEFAELTDGLSRQSGFAAVTDEVFMMRDALKSFGTATSDLDRLESLETVEKLLSGMRLDDGSFPNQHITDFAEEFFKLDNAMRQVINANKALVDNGGDVSKQIENDGEAFEKLRINMKEQIIALEDGERAAYKYSLLMSKEFTPAQIEAALKLYDKKKAIEADIEATNEAIEADKKRKKSLDDVSASLDAYFDKESADSTNQDRKATATLTTQVQSIGLTPEEEIKARYDRELELLQQAEEKKIEIEGTYAERRTQIEAERLEALRNLNSDNIDFLSEAFSNLDTQIAGTMAQVVVGAKDGETAMRDLASTMITQVVGALVQQGVELVKNKVLGNVLATSEKANILSTTATGVAAQQTATASTTAAAATTATAAAPAAALTSTFSFGSAALIGGAALLGTLAISKMMASGAREFGGPVTAGKSYLVGERGPEMFTPNTSGGIVSNKDMAGGGSGVSVNINNYSGQEVTQNYDEVRKIVTVEIGKQISGIRSGTGAMAKALKGTTTNKGRATKV